MNKATLFTHKHNESCPVCGSELVIRNGGHGPFQGCVGYPECDYIRPLKLGSDGHIIKILDGQTCPECRAVLVLRQGKYGMFIGCSDYPMCSYIVSTHDLDDTQIPCPECRQGHLLQRKSRFGKAFYACDRYPVCQFALNHAPVADECVYCHYPLLMKKKSASGMKIFCANKLCGKEVLTHDE